MSIEAVFSSITLAIIGTSLFSYLAKKINLLYPLNTTSSEAYVGPFPYFGAVLGTICGYCLNMGTLGKAALTVDWALLGIILGFSVIGYLRDRYRLSMKYCYLLVFLGALTSLYFYLPGINTVNLIAFSCVVLLLIASLKAASFVFEMPFVFIAVTSLTHILYLAWGAGENLKLILIEFSLLTFAAVAILYTFSGGRSLISNSGIFATGVALAIGSILEPNGKLILLDFLMPVMIMVFPVLFVGIITVVSYFGNRLHKKEKKSKHFWNWILKRRKVVHFTAIIYLCLNLFSLMIIKESSSVYGYTAILLVFVFSLAAFMKAFAKKVSAYENTRKKVDVLGTKIDAVTPSEVLDRISSYLKKPETEFLHIITADSLAVVRTKNEPEFKAKMEAAEMVVPDGAGIVWAADFLGTPLPGRVPGVALVSQICEASAKEGHKIFFIGSKPGVAQKAAEMIIEKTKANIVGVEHGYFKADSEDEEKMLQKIADSGADIVFVALGVPRQEDFITKLRKYGKQIVAVGVGGSFDVISGSLPRAPQWMQNCGIEWLFRLWLEPKRISRMLEIPVFVLKVMQYKINRD